MTPKEKTRLPWLSIAILIVAYALAAGARHNCSAAYDTILGVTSNAFAWLAWLGVAFLASIVLAVCLISNFKISLAKKILITVPAVIVFDTAAFAAWVLLSGGIFVCY